MSVLPRLGKIVSSRTALLVCDMQEKFRYSISHFNAICATSGRLIAAAKMLEMPVVITEMYPKGLGQTVEDLGDISDIPVIPKSTFTMITPEVDRQVDLRGGSIDSVILCGIETHVCVQRTALDLLERGLAVHCVADAISSRSMTDRAIGLERMRQAGAFITTSESVILGLVDGCRHPSFKTLQKLILPLAPDTGLLSGKSDLEGKV